MDRELAIDNLKMLKALFDEFGIQFWLDGGTLLGAVREGKIIEWDHDVDLCMWNRDRKKLFSALNELKRRKGKIILAYPLHPNFQSITLKLPPFEGNIDVVLWPDKADKLDNLTLNLEGMYGQLTLLQRFFCMTQDYFALVRHFLYYDFSLSLFRKPDTFIARILEYSLPPLPQKLKMFLLRLLRHWKIGYYNWVITTPKHYFENLGTIEFYGLTFNIPSDVEAYLKYHYGEDWKTPRKKWRWLEDDKARPIRAPVTSDRKQQKSNT
jgi:lipopolysaccharide cholinephosphotransferase